MRRFLKMHGAGNDFVLLDGDREVLPSSEEIRLMADRRLGIGCDQLVVLQTLENSNGEERYVRLRFFNADGGEADACGNGTRCAGWWYMTQHGAARLRVQVGSRELAVWQENGQVWVDMGAADFSAHTVGFVGDSLDMIAQLGLSELPLQQATLVAMPNPHLVLHLSAAATDAMVAEHGPRLETHAAFARRANIGFVWADGGQWFLRVWERGAGETSACGSGACAAFAALQREGHFATSAMKCHLPGGVLSLARRQDSVLLSGPVALTFSGEWHG